MNPEAPTDLDAFRDELRAWLSEHCTERYRDLDFRGEPDSTPGSNACTSGTGSWPTRDGRASTGPKSSVGGASVSRIRSSWPRRSTQPARPARSIPIGLANIAPSIMAYGTDAQKERLLRPMLRGDEIWCQGFSEPDAGSDLASLTTRAERDGDGWILNGQKVWNTFGQLARWCELLARTDPDRVEAQGHLVLHRRHGTSGHRGPSAPHGDGRCRVLRDLLRRRADPRRRAPRARAPGLDRGDGDAHVRAQRRGQPAHLDPPPHS